MQNCQMPSHSTFSKQNYVSNSLLKKRHLKKTDICLALSVTPWRTGKSQSWDEMKRRFSEETLPTGKIVFFSFFPILLNPNKLLGKLLLDEETASSQSTRNSGYPQCQKIWPYPRWITSRKKLLLFPNVLDSLKGHRSCMIKSFAYNELLEVLLKVWSN